MNEAVLILPNMRGGCATVGNTVHTLFRVTGRRPRPMACPDAKAAGEQHGPRSRPGPPSGASRDMPGMAPVPEYRGLLPLRDRA